MLQFIALSSSRGTTFQAILDRIADGSLDAECVALVTDKPDRGCVARAEAAGIPVRVVAREPGEEREAYDKRLSEVIEEILYSNEVADRSRVYIAAVGWMWLLSGAFVAAWKDRIINVHPSLLPKFPGAHAHRDVLLAGETETGMTIHCIDDGVDTGRILLQKSCPVLPGDTEETLKQRVQALEQEWYPKVLQMIATGELR